MSNQKNKKQGEKIENGTRIITSDSLEDAVKVTIESLSSTNPKILRIMTEERSIDEAFRDSVLEGIAINYNLKWLNDLIQIYDARRRAHKRQGEKNIVSVAKSLVLREQHKQRAVWDRFKSIFGRA